MLTKWIVKESKSSI